MQTSIYTNKCMKTLSTSTLLFANAYMYMYKHTSYINISYIHIYMYEVRSNSFLYVYIKYINRLKKKVAGPIFIKLLPSATTGIILIITRRTMRQDPNLLYYYSHPVSTHPIILSSYYPTLLFCVQYIYISPRSLTGGHLL